jgi:flagellar assembly factor FliW
MIVKSCLLGELEIEATDIIHFAAGIPAFEEYKQYILIPLEDKSPFYYMQSVQEPDLCLIIANPFVFFPNYEVEVDDEELQSLDVQEGSGDLAIYVILSVPEDFKLTTANLLAPILINPQNRQAAQYVVVNAKYSTRHLIFPPEQPAAAGKGGV